MSALWAGFLASLFYIAGGCANGIGCCVTPSRFLFHGSVDLKEKWDNVARLKSQFASNYLRIHNAIVPLKSSNKKI